MFIKLENKNYKKYITLEEEEYKLLKYQAQYNKEQELKDVIEKFKKDGGIVYELDIFKNGQSNTGYLSSEYLMNRYKSYDEYMKMSKWEKFKNIFK